MSTIRGNMLVRNSIADNVAGDNSVCRMGRTLRWSLAPTSMEMGSVRTRLLHGRLLGHVRKISKFRIPLLFDEVDNNSQDGSRLSQNPLLTLTLKMNLVKHGDADGRNVHGSM